MKKNSSTSCLGCLGLIIFFSVIAEPRFIFIITIIVLVYWLFIRLSKINKQKYIQQQSVHNENVIHTDLTVTDETTENIQQRTAFFYAIKDSFKSNYVVLDVETTGLDHYDCDIIQISILAYTNHKLVDKYVSYVRPVYDELTPKITRITGIKQSDLDDAPTFKAIADDIYNLINNQLIIAHNAKFDMGFICESFKRYGFDKNVELTAFDTWKASRRYIKGLQNYKLETLKKHFKIDVKSHDAYNDCLVTQKVYEHIYHLVSAEYSYDDFQIETHKRIARIINKKQLYVFKHKTKGDYAIGVFYTALKYHIVGKNYVGLYDEPNEEIVNILSNNDLKLKEAPKSVTEKYRIYVDKERFNLFDDYVVKKLSEPIGYIPQKSIDEADIRSEFIKRFLD